MNAVIIRPIDLNDTESIVQWRNEDSVRSRLFSQELITAEQHIKYYNDVIKTGKCIQYIIEINGDDTKKIGTVFLKNIDYNSKKAEYGIFIGEEGFRGMGYAKIATRLILAQGFNVLQLNRVYLMVLADNFSAIRLYESAGFRYEGTMKEAYLRDNEYVDVVIMAILRENWEALKEINENIS